MDFEQARAQFPVLDSFAYLNAGTCGPLARSTVEAMEVRLRVDLERGRSGAEMFAEVMRLREQVRARLASIVGAAPEQVALTCSTTDGCNIVLAGLDLSPSDEVVTTTDEHFGLLGPLHASGAQIIVVAPDPDVILAAVTPRTRLLALSQVLWTTGHVLPVAELRERSGLPVLVDGAQAVGAIPVDAAGLDFLTVSAQKWLCGPDTLGALIVADPERLRVAQPSYLSQRSFGPDGDFRPRAGAARFDSQWLAPASLAGLLAALATVPEWSYDRARAMTERCREDLSKHFEVLSAAGQGTLVTWRCGGDPSAVVASLHEHDVIVRDIPVRKPQVGRLRASCGWWTSESDIERLLGALVDNSASSD